MIAATGGRALSAGADIVCRPLPAYSAATSVLILELAGAVRLHSEGDLVVVSSADVFRAVRDGSARRARACNEIVHGVKESEHSRLCVSNDKSCGHQWAAQRFKWKCNGIVFRAYFLQRSTKAVGFAGREFRGYSVNRTL